MRIRHLLALLLTWGCNSAAPALSTHYDGGPGDAGAPATAPCSAASTPWRVSVTGAVEYDSMTNETPAFFQAVVRQVGGPGATFSLDAGGPVDVVISPPPAIALGALQVGASVNVRLDHGIVIDEYGTLVLASVEGLGTASESPTVDVATYPGVHFAAADARCTTKGAHHSRQVHQSRSRVGLRTKRG